MPWVCACFGNALVPPKFGVTLHKTHTNGRERGGEGEELFVLVLVRGGEHLF